MLFAALHSAGMHDASSLSCLFSDTAAAYMQMHGLLESVGTDAHLTASSHVRLRAAHGLAQSRNRMVAYSDVH